MKRIAVTGACGQISYSLLFKLISGELLGNEEKITLHLLDLPPFISALEGIEMELKDTASPLLDKIIIGTDPYKVFEEIDFAFLIGAKPRGPGMERKELLQENAKIFVEQGKALGQVASPKVKVLVVGNPCNTNCLIASRYASNILPQHFHAMTRLDQNRMSALLATKADCSVEAITHATIWGNHSPTMVPDFYNTKITSNPVTEIIHDEKWLKNEFMHLVQQRGAHIIEKRGKSSAASAAFAAIDAMKAIIYPTKKGHWYSSAILSDGNPYGIEEGIVYSFPMMTKEDGTIEVVKDLPICDFIWEKMKLSEKELLEERSQVVHLL